MKTKTLFCAILFLCGCLLSSCLYSSASEGEEKTDAAESAPIYLFNSVKSMKRKVPETDGATVMLEGYYEPNDGGGGMFYWDAAETAPDNGGTVIAPSGKEEEAGRYVRVGENHYVNVKWFGAVGDKQHDDTAAIQAAIDSLPNDGGTVVVPGGVYKITSTLQIGNGTAEKASEKNGIKLIGTGGTFGYMNTELTTFLASGTMETMLSVNGPISDVEIQGFKLWGSNTAKTLLYLSDLIGCEIENITGGGFIGTGIVYTAQNAELGGSRDNRFKSLSIGSVNEGTTYLYIGGDFKSGALVEDTIFTDSRFDPNTTKNVVSVDIRYAENLTFMRCHLCAYDREYTTALRLDASANGGYPRGNSFYDCNIENVEVIEDETHKIGYNFFLGYGVYDLQDAFAPNEHLFGITESGGLIRYDG